jgi:GNAT superfamily N-acetyltransferase
VAVTRFQYDPPVTPKLPPGPFVQHIRTMNGRTVLARACWYLDGDANEGVVQILDLSVADGRGRQGLGTALVGQVLDQAQRALALRGGRLRRVWAAVPQKSRLIGRAFLTARGFHHVTTVSDMLRDEDLLVYQRSMD